MKGYIGIDPGKSGCLAILCADGDVYFYDYPKDGDLAAYYTEIQKGIEYKELTVELAVLERVHAMPKQGVSSMFTFGANFGGWQTWLIMQRYPHQIIPPQVWMKGFVSKGDGKNTKQCIAVACKRLFPNVVLEGPKGGYKDGRADALMMAYYAKRLCGGVPKRRS